MDYRIKSKRQDHKVRNKVIVLVDEQNNSARRHVVAFALNREVD